MSDADDMEAFYGFENTEEDFQDEVEEKIKVAENGINNARSQTLDIGGDL